MKAYPVPSRLAADYNPDLQFKLSNSRRTIADIALNESIPTLALVRSVYGEENAERWLKTQFESLNSYAEQGQGITDKQISELCALFLSEYYYLNLAEVCFFIARFKLGKYGQFYGAIGPMKITCAMLDYIRERRQDIERYEREEYSRQRQREIEERGKDNVPYAVYLELKRRAESGDEEAKRKLRPK